MEARDLFLSDFRGPALGNIHNNSSADEIFQNETLRPILKLQNNLFVAVFKNYIIKSKVDFSRLSVEKKLQFIEHSIQRDIKFRNALKGMVIALFTVTEFEAYIQNSSALNKRMMGMLIERLKNQVQLFDMQAAI